MIIGGIPSLMPCPWTYKDLISRRPESDGTITLVGDNGAEGRGRRS